MNKLKQLAVIFLVFMMCFGMCMPVYATTLELMPPKLKAFDGNICTVKYYTPDDVYTKVLIIGTKTDSWASFSKYHLVFIKPEQTFQNAGNYKCFTSPEVFYYLTFSTYEDAIECLFHCDSALDYTVSPSYQTGNHAYCLHGGFSYPEIFLYQEERFANEAASSIEAAYYDWYVEEFGEEPKFETVEDESDGDFSGIIATLKEVVEALKAIAFPDPDYDFIIDMNNKLANKLEGNGFYTSICRIQRELTSIYNQDYSDPAEFHKINPAKITLRRPVIAGGDDGFNGSYTYSKIDWGLDNVSVLGDMKWFFGTHPSTGKTGGFINIDGTPAVKHYSDALISAFLWIGFAFMLWQRLPDILSGEFATITTTSADMINTSVAGNRTVEDMYRTTKVDMSTGEVLSDTMTTKRRMKK